MSMSDITFTPVSARPKRPTNLPIRERQPTVFDEPISVMIKEGFDSKTNESMAMEISPQYIPDQKTLTKIRALGSATAGHYGVAFRSVAEKHQDGSFTLTFWVKPGKDQVSDQEIQDMLDAEEVEGNPRRSKK